MIRKLTKDEAKLSADGTYLLVEGVKYEVVSPSDPIYGDHDYVEFDNGLFVKG